jgi:L-2,4-diaminobutyric acid acetyltransferase
MKSSEINYRHPTLDDGSKIYSLVKSCPPLDVNSQYFYYILCKDFSNTCVVAEYDRNLLGFVSAYLQPEKPQSLFIWQVAVVKNERRKRLALNMLDWLIKQPKCINIQFMETTVSPLNQPSQKLFIRFAKDHNANFQTRLFLDKSNFDNESHEEEILYTISPLN